MAERVIRTIKNMLYKQFIVQNNQKWYKILPETVSAYNKKVHSTIKMIPEEASTNPEKLAIINENSYYNETNLKNKS